jgi:putative molybdopterin biosynthesis protein
MKRTIYLNMRPKEEARNLFLSRFAEYRTGLETVAARAACGRVTAAPVHARFSSPSYHSAAMDGLAVRAEETFSAADHSPVTLHLDTGQAVMINTGYPMPPDKNAVVMIENVLLKEAGATGVIRSPVYPWQNVRKVGEDIVATELLFPTGHQLQPADVAALITGGCSRVAVRKRPRLVIIPTGSELVPLEDTGQELPPGKIVESNSAVLSGLAEQVGAKVDITPIIGDGFEAIRGHLLTTLQAGADMVLINAGSSAGSADYTVRVIAELGEVLVHGVTIMPGKPTILGVVDGKPVVGIPGYPVSAIIAMEQFVVPLLAKMQGVHVSLPVSVKAALARDLPSRAGIEEFRRMIVGRIDGKYIAAPLKKGAGAITSMTRANAILRIDAKSEGEVGGSVVDIDLLAPPAQVERTLLCTGSHDLSLDILNDQLRKRNPAYILASTHVGSFGGIMAIRRGMCHMAGSHLLDPRDGSYNVSALKQYLPGKQVRLVTLVHREQGFIVPVKNPKGIASIQDLLREDITFVNRQAGSGTRVLLDYELERGGLDGDGIKGYDQEEYTHMAVAVAVLSGKVDVGLGIKSAARALGLDFVPLVEERYDLVFTEEAFNTPMIQALLELIQTAGFKDAVAALGGYSTRETGCEVAIL